MLKFNNDYMILFFQIQCFKFEIVNVMQCKIDEISYLFIYFFSFSFAENEHLDNE